MEVARVLAKIEGLEVTPAHALADELRERAVVQPVTADVVDPRALAVVGVEVVQCWSWVLA